MPLFSIANAIRGARSLIAMRRPSVHILVASRGSGLFQWRAFSIFPETVDPGTANFPTKKIKFFDRLLGFIG